MNTRERIQELYLALQSALPQYPVFLNEDGRIQRNTVHSVEDALSQEGVAIIVCARVTTRMPRANAKSVGIRVLSVPIEIRTQQLDHKRVPSVSDILDQIEPVLIQLGDLISNWELVEAGEYENKPGWGFIRVNHQYVI